LPENQFGDQRTVKAMATFHSNLDRIEGTVGSNKTTPADFMVLAIYIIVFSCTHCSGDALKDSRSAVWFVR